jgi:hypothetical protein
MVLRAIGGSFRQNGVPSQFAYLAPLRSFARLDQHASDISQSFRKVARPYDYYRPARFAKHLLCTLVSLLICLDFLTPEPLIGFWCRCSLAAMAMPEASMNKYTALQPREYQIRSPRQSFGVKSISQTKSMQVAPDC